MQFIDLHPGKTVEKSYINSFKSDISSNRYIYIMAGIHGDDLSGVYILHQLFNYLKEVHLELPFIILPILNIDGHRFGTQTNSHGVDLFNQLSAKNNNFSSEENIEPELKYILKMLDKYPPALTILFHPVEQNEFIGHFPSAISKYFKHVNFTQKRNDLTPSLSLPNFLQEKFGTSVLTLNGSASKRESSLQSDWDKIKKGLMSFIGSPEIKLFLKDSEELLKRSSDPSTEYTGGDDNITIDPHLY